MGRDDEPLDLGDEPLSRRRKSGVPAVWLILGGVILIALMIGYVIVRVENGIAGVGERAGPSPGNPLTDPTDFGDHPERYKGKTIDIEAEWKPMVEVAGMSLRKGAGENCPFLARGRGSATVDFWVVLPAAEGMPDAKPGETVRVTFACTGGKLNEGNKGVRITRP